MVDKSGGRNAGLLILVHPLEPRAERGNGVQADLTDVHVCETRLHWL
jgi:hypothetical protein